MTTEGGGGDPFFRGKKSLNRSSPQAEVYLPRGVRSESGMVEALLKSKAQTMEDFSDESFQKNPHFLLDKHKI